jgi:hypothetical protein
MEPALFPLGTGVLKPYTYAACRPSTATRAIDLQQVECHEQRTSFIVPEGTCVYVA